MGLKRVTTKFLKYAVPTMLVLLIIPFSERGRRAGRQDNIFGDNHIRCAIKLEDRLEDGFQTGYCYEMMERLAEGLHDTAEIFLALEDGDYLDSLRVDSLDILAVRTEDVPESDGFMAIPLGEVPVSWVIKSDKRRQREIIRWMNNFRGTNDYSSILTAFFHGYNPYRKGTRRDPGTISPYDDLIKKNAARIGWDWKMLAALVWCESKFRIQARSAKGALGLMQMMPRTANRYEIENLLDPEDNIKAGADFIARLQGKFKDIAADKEELMKFTLAAYNAGEGRIYDCINLARSQGVDTGTWESLCTVIPQMSQDSVLLSEDVLHGKFKGSETVAYVKAVLNCYDMFNGVPPRYKVQPTDTALIMIEGEEEKEGERILLSPDSLGRIDLGDEQARNQEEDHDDKPGEGVSGKHRR